MFDGTGFTGFQPITLAGVPKRKKKKLLRITLNTVAKFSAQSVFDYVVRKQWKHLMALPGYASDWSLPSDFHGTLQDGRPWACAIGEIATAFQVDQILNAENAESGFWDVTLHMGRHESLGDDLMSIHDSVMSVVEARAAWPAAWRALAKSRGLNAKVVEEVCGG